MPLPEILPLLTTDRVMWEIFTNKVGEKELYDWRPVRNLGNALTAETSPLDHLQCRECRLIESTDDQVDYLIDKARVRVFFRGKEVGGQEAIPSAHRDGLSAKIYRMSSVGADPFADLPAGSQP